MNLAGDRWAGVEHWEKNARKMTLDAIFKRSDVVTVGIDGGGLDDLLAIAVLGRDKQTKEWLHWGHAWAHEGVLKRYPGEVTKLRGFESDGDLTIYRASEVGKDVREVGDIVARCEKSGLLDQIGVDQAGIGAIVEELVARKIEMDRIIGIPQGWKLMGAIQTSERHLSASKLLHCGQPLMAYAVGNAKVEPRGNAIMVTKQISGRSKIDPLMALFDAVALMQMNPKPRAKTYQMLVLGA
jgi:phage terminase large subunit-like protein